MNELRLFNLNGSAVEEAHAEAYKLEKDVQSLFESNLETLLGVRFVASEFVAGSGNRIDTLGLDENNFPVALNTSSTKTARLSTRAWPTSFGSRIIRPSSGKQP